MPTGFTLWFTGLSGSGKSTLANAVGQALAASGRLVDVLDGDVVRQHLCKGLGFSREDRDTNIRRIGFVAHLITRHGGVAITAAISPYRALRDENRKRIGTFVEVYCRCPLAECERRDVKGLYRKAREALAIGQPMGFTGVDDPYEEPLAPEVTVETAQEGIAESAAKIMRKLQALGYLDAATPRPRDSALTAARIEFLPEELVTQAEEALKKAGRIHTEVLLRELQVGLPTAARLLDRLAEKGVIRL